MGILAGLVRGNFHPGLVQDVSEAHQAALLVGESLPVVRRNRCPCAGSTGLLLAVTLAFSELMGCNEANSACRGKLLGKSRGALGGSSGFLRMLGRLDSTVSLQG